MLTAAREHPVHHDLHAQLLSAFKRYLCEYQFTGIRHIDSIQALLLLSLWPMPARNQGCDPSWNYCHLAVSAALQMGLARSTPSSGTNMAEASADEEEEARLKTWLGCFVVSNRYVFTCVLQHTALVRAELTNIFPMAALPPTQDFHLQWQW